MRLMVSLVLLLSLCPMWAGLGRELGSLPAGAHDGRAPQGGKGNIGQTSQAQTSDKKPMTNADVINMVKAGLTENTIVLDIQLSPTAFDTSPQALITLKSQGVPQGILDVMLTSGGGKPSPPAAPPAPTPAPAAGGGANGKLSASPVPSGPAKSSEIKSPPPDLHKIRKVHLMIEEWAEDDNARARATRAIQKYTCLQVVDTPEAADALLSWETQGLMGAALDLYTKDGQDLWNKRGLTAPVKALSQAVGCP